jgi:type VI secretion system protein VasJ
MRQEIDALASIRADAPAPDWGRVAELGSELLTTVGKDLTVASWLSTALLWTAGERGIADGAGILADICSLYWESLYPPPPRQRARLGAIDWWQDQVEDWLEKKQPESLPSAIKEEADGYLRVLEETINTAVPDNTLRLRSLRSRLKAIPSPEEGQATPRPPQEAPPQAPSPQAPEPAGNRGEQGRAEPDATSDSFSADCSRFCLDAADAQLQVDFSSPASYVLRRSALWAFLRAAPPAEGGRTLLPPPEEGIAQGLDALLSSGKCEQAVREAESRLAGYIYWLDLSRISALALTGLGPEYNAARLALEGQTAGLVLRFPALLSLAFSDGTPFADSATRAWLAGMAGGGKADQDPWAGDMEMALRQPPGEALATLGDMLLRHPSGRLSLAIYKAAFEVCSKGRLWRPLPFLGERLLDLVRAHRIDSYDPEAAAGALSSAAAALDGALTEEPDNGKAREQYVHICAELAGLQPHRLVSAPR